MHRTHCTPSSKQQCKRKLAQCNGTWKEFHLCQYCRSGHCPGHNRVSVRTTTCRGSKHGPCIIHPFWHLAAFAFVGPTVVLLSRLCLVVVFSIALYVVQCLPCCSLGLAHGWFYYGSLYITMVPSRNTSYPVLQSKGVWLVVSN